MARDMFIVHHTEGPENQSIASIRNFHVNVRGWSDIGYNFLIRNDGTVHRGRGWGVTGAHARGYNSRSIGVAMIGSFDDKMPSRKALGALVALYRKAEERYGNMQFIGHRDVNSTSCPGGKFYREFVNNGPGNINGGTGIGDDEMNIVDVEFGDRGPRAKTLQVLLHYCGADLGEYGVDGVFGADTQDAYYWVRKQMGSTVTRDECRKVSEWGFGQILKALAIQSVD